MQKIQLSIRLKRLLALCMALAIVFGTLPVFSYADGAEETSQHEGEHKVTFEAKVDGEVKTFSVLVKHKETIAQYYTHDQITKELGVHEVDFKNWLNKKDGSTFHWDWPVTKDMTIIFEPEHTSMKKGLMVLIHTEDVFEPVSHIIYVMNSDGYEFVNHFTEHNNRVEISDEYREALHKYIVSLFSRMAKINGPDHATFAKEMNSVLEKENPFFKTVEKELIDLGYNKDDYSHVYIDSVLGVYANHGEEDYSDSETYRLDIYLKPNIFEVSFDTGGAEEIKPQVLEHRSYVEKVSEPVKENHKFLGWYNGDVKWDFDYRDKAGEETEQFRLMGNMTLKAKWEKIEKSEDKKDESVTDNNSPVVDPDKDDKKDENKQENKEEKKDENKEEKKNEKEDGDENTNISDNNSDNSNSRTVIDKIQSFDEASYPVYEDWNIEDDIIPLGERDREYLTYIQGYEDKSVRAEANLTRGEAAAVIYRLIDPDLRELVRTSENNLVDVNRDKWSNKHISSLVKAKIFTGYEDGSFRPEEDLTRAQLAVLFVKLYRLNLVEGSDFTDIKGHWAEKYIASTAKTGSLKGYGDGLFRPDEAITRAEFVTVMNRALNRSVNKGEILQGVKEFKDLSEDSWYYEDMVVATNSYTAERKEDNSQKWQKLLDLYVEM